jgi:AcrR family transcriptional regulator
MLLDRVLDAAEAVVVRQGIANLTLEAVAAEAGISKGGLLYHFPTKDRLIDALVRRSAENWRTCYMDAYGRAPAGPGRMARALLSHCLSDARLDGAAAAQLVRRLRGARPEPVADRAHARGLPRPPPAPRRGRLADGRG